MLVDFRHQLLFLDDADVTIDEFTVLNKHKRGDVHDAELHSDVAVLVGVALADHGLAFKFSGDLLHDGSDAPARAAPSCPKINDDQFVALNQGFKIFIVNCSCHSILVLNY